MRHRLQMFGRRCWSKFSKIADMRCLSPYEEPERRVAEKVGGSSYPYSSHLPRHQNLLEGPRMVFPRRNGVTDASHMINPTAIPHQVRKKGASNYKSHFSTKALGHKSFQTAKERCDCQFCKATILSKNGVWHIISNLWYTPAQPRSQLATLDNGWWLAVFDRTAAAARSFD